jgi:N-acetylglutamate synthase-like GNAT family acetyltransferase
MKIRQATKKDYYESLKIVRELREWFDKKARKNTPIDFKVNKSIVAVENNKVLGFLNYFSKEGVVVVNWLGVKKDYRRKGIGASLLGWIEKEARKLNSKYIQVETLSEKYKYKPYEETRNFYYKKGFKKIRELKAARKGWDNLILLEKRLD